MLRGLSNSDIIDIGAGVKVCKTTCEFGNIAVGPQLVYVRPFYDKLLGEIRKRSKVALIGNSGVGKSTFQYYYLARILNPKLFGELPPDRFGNTAPPRFVLREDGTVLMLYDINRQEAWKITNHKYYNVFRRFNPRETLHLVEPGYTTKEPLSSGDVPTLATLPPDPARYHLFVKGGAAKLFMPNFKEEELLAIGTYLRNHDLVPNRMKEYFENDMIRKRFYRFGGIIRHVLHLSEDYMRLYYGDYDVSKLLRNEADIELPGISEYLLQYDVSIEGVKPFVECRMILASDYVRDQLSARLHMSSVDDQRRALIRNDEIGYLNDSMSTIFEGWVFNSLTSAAGVEWKKQTALRGEARRADDEDDDDDDGSGGAWEPLKLRLSPEEAAAPRYADMKPGVLYYSGTSDYPFADLVFKENDKEGTLVLIQVTRQLKGKKQQVASSAVLLLEKLGLQDSYESTPIKVVLVPGPRQCKSLTLALLDFNKGNEKAMNERKIAKENKEKLVAKLAQYEVWAIPRDYSSKF